MDLAISRVIRSLTIGIGILCVLIGLTVVTGCGSGGGTANVVQPAGSINGHLYLSPDQQTLSTTRSTGSSLATGADVRVQGVPLQTTTDANGMFTLDGVPPGLHHVIVSHTGHQMLDVPVTVTAGQIAHLETAQLASATSRKWTVLVYMNADNDLEPYGIQDLNEMESAPSNDQVAVIVQADRSPGYDTSNGNWTDTRRIRIQHDDDPQTITSPTLETLGEVDMGKPQSAQDFLAWGLRMFPADHYLFIFWNHGNGWRSRAAISAVVTRGISYDDTSGTYIRINELPAALAPSAPVDLVAFDACLMQMLEIGYELRNNCHYVVASEDDVPGEGYDYQTWLTPLAQNPSMSPRDLADTIQREAWKSYSAVYSNVTYSVIDTGELAGVASSVDRLSKALIGVAQTYPSELAAARDQADAYADPEYKDLYHYAALIKAKIPKATVRDAADAVMAAVQRAVVAEYHANGHPNAHGLSIFMPSPTGYARSSPTTYRSLALSIQTQWDEWLGKQAL